MGPHQPIAHLHFDCVTPSGLEATISPVFSPVLPVIAAVFAAVVSSVHSVSDDDGATDRGNGAAPASVCEWHGQTPSFASASIAAITAWVGMRPLATSWPPA
jgi:uncharacterized membrane protein